MYFELIRDAAGQTNQPYERTVQDLNMHGRGFARKFNRRGVKLLLGWAGKGTTEPLGFAPDVANILAKAGELVCHVHDDECDHATGRL